MKKKKFQESNKIHTEELNTELGIITGIAVSYGKETRNGTVYDDKANFREQLPLLFNHDHDKVIGYVKFSKEKSGVMFEAHFNLETALGKEVFANVKHGDLDGVSIGAIGSYTWEEDTDQLLITDYELIELSVVTVPANDEARIKTVESLKEELKTEEKKEVKKEAKMSLSEKIELVNEKKTKLTKTNKKMKQLLERVAVAENFEELETFKEEIENKKTLIETLKTEIENEENEITKETVKIEELKNSIKENNEIKEKEIKMPSNSDAIYSKEAFAKTEKANNLFKEAFVKTLKSGSKFSEEYRELVTKEGFSGDIDSLFPKGEVTQITDMMENVGTLMPFIARITGITSWSALVNKSEELGHGWGGKSAVKVEQSNELEAVDIVTQYIYKYVTVSREMLDQPNNVLYNYVIKELAERLIITLEKAAVVGQTDITSIVPIVRGDDDFVTNLAIDIDGDTLDLANAEIVTNGSGVVVAVMNKKTYTQLKLLKEANGFRSYERGTVVIAGKTYDTLNGFVIVEKNFMEDGVIAMFESQAYTIISYQTNAEMLLDFKLETNTRQFLTEIRAGGNLTKIKSGAVVTSK